ncbi:hypothetical protein [Actinomadura sp. 3N508]|uniref:hypothetical protein n=1 Tax=Actinomadura sp. 3N508 TaxID=3375153 RepID=UPI00379D6F81
MIKTKLTALAHLLSPARRAIRPERLQALTDDELAGKYQEWVDRRPHLAAVVLGEAARRDLVNEKARKERARKERRRIKEAEYKDAYALWLEAHYKMAEEHTRGHLLTKEGWALGVDPMSLFSGQWARARKYASPELLAFWEMRPRVTYSEFKQRSREQAPEEIAA